MVKLSKSILYFSTSRLASWLQWMKPHELPAAHTYIRFLHNPLLRTALAAVSREAGLWFVACRTDLKDNLSVTDGEQRRSPNLPLIFEVTGLCLNVTGHKARTHAASPGPAHVIISTDSSPRCSFVLLLQAHWFKGTTYYSLLARE